MSSFRVQLNDPKAGGQRVTARPPKLAFDGVSEPTRRSKKVFLWVALGFAGLIAAAAIGLFVYYQSLKGTPEYSLAVLVDAAKRDDRAEMDTVVDINAVVEDFLPQITDKAVELYGRGQNPQVIERAKRLATPLMPAVKERARAELPRVIRERTNEFGYVPFFAMVMGADRYLDIVVTGDVAVVKSKIAERPLELKMRRNGDRWQIVGVREEQIALGIARKIGQEIMYIASSGSRSAADRFGVGNLAELIRQAEEELVK